MKKLCLAVAMVLSCAGAALLSAADWPCWLGPLRQGASPETDLLTTWPKQGPKVLWKVAGGNGYSSVAVAQGRAVTLVQHDDGIHVLALGADDGKKLWETKVGPFYKNSYGNGPRSTPTIDGKNVYVQLPNGPLACLDAEKGNIVWSIDILKDFSSKNISWGLSASPLVDGDLVYALPGGQGAGVIALNKLTGKLVWKTGNDRPGYATPMPVAVDGKKQILFFTAAGLLATEPLTGKELWRVAWHTEFDCNICTPLPIGKNLLFVSSGEQNGCTMFELAAAGPPKVRWESKGKKSVMMNYWANAVAVGGHLYGISGEFNEKKMDLNCVDLNTGELKWSQKNFGKAALTLADGHLFITTKKGDLVLVPAIPTQYEEKARVSILGENRTVPTISNKRLYLRDRRDILCLDISGK